MVTMSFPGIEEANGLATIQEAIRLTGLWLINCFKTIFDQSLHLVNVLTVEIVKPICQLTQVRNDACCVGHLIYLAFCLVS
jgi:hypothetical protein